jgi:HemX protein
MQVVAIGLAAVLYLTATARFAMRLVRARPGATVLVAVIIAAGVLSHLVGIALYWVRYGEPPLVGLGPSLTSLALLLALALAGIVVSESARSVGLFLAPAAALLLIVAILVGIKPTGSVLAFRGSWLALHIFLSFLGYVGWFVAAVAALMYLLQFRQLKHKHLGAVFEFFPSLGTLDKLSEWALAAGFLALTLGISLGWAWTIRFEGGFRWSDPKVVWALIAWFALLLALWARFSGRRTIQQAAVWNVAGFGVVSLAYFVAKMIIAEGQFFL